MVPIRRDTSPQHLQRKRRTLVVSNLLYEPTEKAFEEKVKPSKENVKSSKEAKQSPTTQLKLAKSLLKSQFGHTEFLKGQEDVLKLLFEGKNACAIFPSGYLQAHLPPY